MKLSHRLFTAHSTALCTSLCSALAAFVFLATPATTAAQTMKPGLWEITSQMQGAAGSKVDAAMAEMQKQMAGMSPEQRKMIEDSMAKQGVKLAGSAGGGMKVQMCMTREMIERNEVASSQQGDCTQTRSPRSGNTLKFSFECTKPPSKGEGLITFDGAEAYTMKVTTTIKGKAESMEMQGSGKWLSADCGNVKPPPVTK